MFWSTFTILLCCVLSSIIIQPISYPNPPSIAFHEKHGYKTVAHFHASGYKQDAWHDMIWMEKTLCPHTIPPRPFIPFPEL